VKALQYVPCAILVLLSTGAAALADDAPRLADIFQDGMVLQREMPVPVWGWAAPNAKVAVSFAGQTLSAQANDKGYWKVVLQPLKASRSGGELVMRSGSSQVTLENVVVGEVWVSVGHSIMGAQGPDLDTGVFPHYVSPGTSGGGPEIRIREFGWGASRDPLDDTAPAGRGKLKWLVMPENPPRKNMYIGQYFSRVIRDGQQVPVGLIQVAVPGTRMLTYTSRKTLESFPATTGGYANYYEESVAGWEKGQAAAKSAIKSWGDVKTWLDKHNGPAPGEGLGYPAALYNTRIHPLAPFAIRGVISMQLGAGGYAADYARSFVAPFKQWRELFGQDFYIIILTHARDTANYQPPLKPMVGWFYRTDLATRNSLSLYGGDPRVEYVELYDIGDFSVHYFSAAEAGRRAGLAALAKAYGESRLYTGPRIKKYALEGGRVRIEFEHCGTGLVYQPSINGISGIYLRGSDGATRWADVKLLNPNTIECSHPDIKKVQCVASGYYPNPHETLFPL
jgi:sialate O-acetylesterase